MEQSVAVLRVKVAKQQRHTDECAPAPKRARASSLLPSPTAVSLPPPRKPLPPHQLILAPMVGGSELAFRLLARRHGAQLCYTPMIHQEDWSEPGAGVNLLERHVDDCPLVAHFSGDDPQKLLNVALEAERCSGVVAIDLNLGCLSAVRRAATLEPTCAIQRIVCSCSASFRPSRAR